RLKLRRRERKGIVEGRYAGQVRYSRRAEHRATEHPVAERLDLLVAERERTREVSARAVRGHRPGRHLPLRRCLAQGVGALSNALVVFERKGRDATALVALHAVAFQNGLYILPVSDRGVADRARICRLALYVLALAAARRSQEQAQASRSLQASVENVALGHAGSFQKALVF